MLVHVLILFFVVAHINAAPIPMQSAYLYRNTDRKSGFRSRSPLASVLPGDPLITGTLSQGVVTSVSLFSNVLLARFALSWFPQVLKQFPVLKPIITGLYHIKKFSSSNLLLIAWSAVVYVSWIHHARSLHNPISSFNFTVTEPYLKIFRKRIPPVGGFDISAIPAIFILDLVGQATAALGAGFPTDREMLQQKLKLVKKHELMKQKLRWSNMNTPTLSKSQCPV